MARKEKLITRTITHHEFEVMTVNPMTADILNKRYTTSECYDTEVENLAMLRTFYETSDNVIVRVLAHETISNLYGVTEEDFLKIARVLPPRAAQQDSEE